MSTQTPTLTAAKKEWSVDISKKGEYQRRPSAFRSFIKRGSAEFPPQKQRYHLYVSLACPWAHRTLILRKLKGLEDIIGVTVVDYFLDRSIGWTFSTEKPGCSAEPFHGFKNIRQIYKLADPEYDSVISVPVLFDSVRDTIVNNESSEIIQMLNSEFNEFSKTPEQAALDLYPESLRTEVEEVNEWIYHQVNNGVYRSGFAQSQEAYDVAVREVFDGLDKIEERLSKHRYIVGNQLTLADIRLFTTLIRFDPVYVTHFKCNLRPLSDYPNIFAYTRDLYQMPEIKATVDFHHIKQHYFTSHAQINPLGIVPIGLQPNFDAPHDRARFTS